jgi:hypothetical protein
MSGSAATSLAAHAVPARPIAARTRMLLDAPIVPTLLRLAAPNVLNLLAFVGLITFDGLFVGAGTVGIFAAITSIALRRIHAKGSAA